MPFGFEFEVLIPAFALDAKGLAEPPNYVRIPKPRGAQGETTLSPKIGIAHDDTFVASVEFQDRLNNHRSATWPTKQKMTSLELATKPLDELALTAAGVTQTMQQLGAWTTNLLGNVIGGAQPVDNFMTPTVPNRNRIGPTPGHENDPALSASGYVQETYGLRLDKVASEFAQRAKEVPPGLRDQTDWHRPLSMSSSPIAENPVNQALTLFGNLGDPHATEELRGLLTLIRYYSAMRNRNKSGGLGKNTVGAFYYKTALSTVCHDLGAKYQPIQVFLANPGHRQAVCQLITPDASLQPWCLDVLAGVKDSFFEATMNPYSEELLAPALGPANNRSVGVVVENRQFRVTYAPQNATFFDTTSMYAPAQWPTIATRLYTRLRTMHGL